MELSPFFHEWYDDEATSTCANCAGDFWLLKRRHHCRLCGRTFCDDCTTKKTPLPFFGFSRTEIRVCDVCHERLPHVAAMPPEADVLRETEVFFRFEDDWCRCVLRLMDCEKSDPRQFQRYGPLLSAFPLVEFQAKDRSYRLPLQFCSAASECGNNDEFAKDLRSFDMHASPIELTLSSNLVYVAFADQIDFQRWLGILSEGIRRTFLPPSLLTPLVNPMPPLVGRGDLVQVMMVGSVFDSWEPRWMRLQVWPEPSQTHNCGESTDADDILSLREFPSTSEGDLTDGICRGPVTEIIRVPKIKRVVKSETDEQLFHIMTTQQAIAFRATNLSKRDSWVACLQDVVKAVPADRQRNVRGASVVKIKHTTDEIDEPRQKTVSARSETVTEPSGDMDPATASHLPVSTTTPAPLTSENPQDSPSEGWFWGMFGGDKETAKAEAPSEKAAITPNDLKDLDGLESDVETLDSSTDHSDDDDDDDDVNDESAKAQANEAPTPNPVVPSQETSSSTLTRLMAEFLKADSLSESLVRFDALVEAAHVPPGVNLPEFLEQYVQYTVSEAVFKLFAERRRQHPYPKAAQTARTKHVVVIGAGPTGLLFTIEALLCGYQVSVLEAMTEFTRSHLICLWNPVSANIRALGAFAVPPLSDLVRSAKTSTPKYVPLGAFQVSLTKLVLLLGGRLYTGHAFGGVGEFDQQMGAWYLETSCPDPENLSPSPSLFSHAIVGADGLWTSTAHFAGIDRAPFPIPASPEDNTGTIAVTTRFFRTTTSLGSSFQECATTSSRDPEVFSGIFNQTNTELSSLQWVKLGEHDYLQLRTTKMALLKGGVLYADRSDSDDLLDESNLNLPALENLAFSALSSCPMISMLAKSQGVTGNDELFAWIRSNFELAPGAYDAPDVELHEVPPATSANSSLGIHSSNGRTLPIFLVGDACHSLAWGDGQSVNAGLLSAMDAAHVLNGFTANSNVGEAQTSARNLMQIRRDTSRQDVMLSASFCLDPVTRYKLRPAPKPDHGGPHGRSGPAPIDGESQKNDRKLPNAPSRASLPESPISSPKQSHSSADVPLIAAAQQQAAEPSSDPPLATSKDNGKPDQVKQLPRKEGWLKKKKVHKSAFGSKWQPRLVVVQDGRLSYKHDVDEADPGQNDKSYIVLKGADLRGDVHSHSITVTSANRTKTLQFKCEDAASYKDWMNTLRESVK